jgi:two-component system sensor histidine kinase CpxA
VRGLFGKIFLSFFFTVLLLGVLLEISALRNERRRVETVFAPLAAASARNLTDAFERGGNDALAAALQRLPVRGALIDEQGHVVGPLPDGMRETAASAGELIASAREPLAAFAVQGNVGYQPVTSAGGRRFVFVFVLPHERWSAILNTLDQHPEIRLSVLWVVAMAICFLLARHITAPLIHLRATAARMADGHLDARAGPTLTRRHDEIGALGRDFDQMADHIAALVATERRLFADVSHELRSPLARLTVAVGLLRQRGNAAHAEELARIEREVARLDQLIGQSLTLARLDGSAGTEAREPFDLTNLVQEVVADADFEAQASGRRVQLAASDNFVTAGYVELARSAVENVVRNAIRYTAAGTTVDVGVRRDRGPAGDVIRVRVRDHGPGIPGDQLTTVFQPFRKVDDGRRSGGAGLGLAIADRVVKLHGGSISATNAPDGGLIVELEWPQQT